MELFTGQMENRARWGRPGAARSLSLSLSSSLRVSLSPPLSLTPQVDDSRLSRRLLAHPPVVNPPAHQTGGGKRERHDSPGSVWEAAKSSSGGK